MPTIVDTHVACAHCGRRLRRYFGHGFVTEPSTGERVMVCANGRASCYRQVVLGAESLGSRRAL